MKYTDKKLFELQMDDVIYPKGFHYYNNLLKEEMKKNGFKYKQKVIDDVEDNLKHQELVWDLQNMVSELAELVLEERDKRKEVINDLKDTLRQCVRDLK